jgi:hypothetical protein
LAAFASCELLPTKLHLHCARVLARVGLGLKESVMIEPWKIRRELLRVWLQVVDKVTEPWDRHIQRLYDRNFVKNVTIENGTVSPTQKVAIFFAYQPRQIPDSIFVTCKCLVDLGYTIIFVASSPITTARRDRLLEVCWRVVERPNYGYDFGGFRDGIRVMWESGLTVDSLVILNDSIWFPISKTGSILEHMELAGLDFNSPVYENKPGRDDRNNHFQSYLTLIKSKALHSDAFRDYWINYKVSSKKRVVLLRGEKGFSQAMFKAGFGGDAPSTRHILSGLLEKQSDDFLRKTLCYAAYNDESSVIEACNLLAQPSNGDAWRMAVLLHMRNTLASTQPMGAFCYACIMLLNFSFMKKSSYPTVHDGMRWQYLRAVENGDLPAPHPDILTEIRASKMDSQQTTDVSNWAVRCDVTSA